MISFRRNDLEEKIIEETAKSNHDLNEVGSVFRTCQTTDAWLQHMKNLSTKMLITNLILDENV